MKLITWNVNGLRACLTKGFAESFAALDADIFSIQETKMQPGQADFAPEGYCEYLNSAEKKGYSGTACWAKQPPLSVRYGIDKEEHSHEGRAITLEYPEFYLVNLYVPNAQDELARIDYRMQWEDDLRAYLLALDAQKPVIVCGDLNVAHQEIDLKNPKTNRRLYPERTGAYSWWSYRFHAREKNAGWRIDYFLVSERLMPKVKDCVIHSEIFGSDHCPVELDIEWD